MNIGVNYNSIRVQSSSSNDSYMDKEIEKAINRLEEELRYIRKKIIKKRQRIRDLRGV